MTRDDILQLMQRRILILDGATGTCLQQMHLGEADYRGEEFRDHGTPLLGCNDVLSLTQPQIIESLHRAYIDAGADIIECNSFNSNAISLADYGLEHRARDIARAAAQCGRRVADASERPIVVAGDIGPTSKTTSMSVDVNNPSAREMTFGELRDAYREQVLGLVEGGVDVLIIETTFDTLNVKAAIKAIDELSHELGRDLPVMISATLSDKSGRTLSGQTVEAFAASVAHARPLSIGLNCGFGAEQLLPWTERLAVVARCPVSVHPNAGLPNVMGEYDETPESFTRHARAYFERGLVNIYGGCCGTTPHHIAMMAQEATKYPPRALPPPASPPTCTLRGLEAMPLDGSRGFISVGERTTVAGSARFKRLIKEGNYSEALTVARDQVENGAQVIDICMDDGMIDGTAAMRTFLNLIASEPDIARVPVMLDSSRWDILTTGLECVQGKSIVNSISLKEGEATFVERARHIHAMGAAAVVMLFDEQGQADTYERKVEVARRAYKLLKGIGFPTEDIIFDPNVLAIATGMSEHDDYARAFIEACRTIRREMPEVHLSGGISNLSFAFRGNNVLRQAMHSVFLYHAMQAGLDMSILNPAMTTIYSDIPADLRRVVEDAVLNRDSGAAERLIEFAQTTLPQPTSAQAVDQHDTWRDQPLDQRIAHAMLKGLTEHIDADTIEAYGVEGSPLGVIDKYLMPAMERVGQLFGEGQMFLPQVVKSARVMKRAVAAIEPYFEQGELPKNTGKTVLFATVKGDVHDIGKNIAGIVIQCNGYAVHDLGVMVDPQVIVDTAVEEHPLCISLSGLITPSLDEMTRVVQELQRRGLTIPVIVGGATTSELHTALKIAPQYPAGVVFTCKAAADNPAILRHLEADDAQDYIAAHKQRQQELREEYARREAEKKPLLSLSEAQRRRTAKSPALVAHADEAQRMPLHSDNRAESHPTGACACCDPLLTRINWPMFMAAWGIKGHFPEVLDDPEKGEEATRLYDDARQMLTGIVRTKSLRLQVKAQILPAVSQGDDIVITAGDGREYRLTMPRSLRDEPTTQCLADHILSDGEDYICPFVVSAGVGVKEMQEQLRANGDEYRAIMVKLLADRLTEALAEKLTDDLKTSVKWGKNHLRVAFGYSTCPDHSLKRQVLDMLDITPQNSGLSLTSGNMIDPGETICGLIFANSPKKYFTV